MKKMYFVLAIVVLLSLSSCADVGINQTGCLTGHEYGFWGGESEEERHAAGYRLIAPIGVRAVSQR